MTRQLSIIIPVAGESADTLDKLHEWISEWESTKPESEIEWIFSLDDSKQTREAFESSNLFKFSSDEEKFKVTESKKGRGIQMNAGAREARSQTLLFLHCDTRLEQGWYKSLSALPQHFTWGAFRPAIDSQGLLYRLAESFGYIRSRLLNLPYGDQAIFIRRQIFKESGGFCERIAFMEDLDMAQRLNKLAGKAEILKIRAITSNRRWDRDKGAAITQSLKNLLALMAFKSGVGRDKIGSWYMS